jgi:hypothetical protein
VGGESGLTDPATAGPAIHGHDVVTLPPTVAFSVGVQGTSNTGVGVVGQSKSGFGTVGEWVPDVAASAAPGIGVFGRANRTAGRGVVGFSDLGFAVGGVTQAGFAGVSEGQVSVQGSLVATVKNAAVPHPDGSTLWVPVTLHTSRHLLILVEHPPSWSCRRTWWISVVARWGSGRRGAAWPRVRCGRWLL